MSRSPRPAPPPKVCIFCGRTGLQVEITREHVWADWLKNYIPKNQRNHYALTGIIEQSGKLEASVRRWGGDAQSRRLQIVCRHCNNGWMGQLQESVKPILVPMIEGEPKLINQIGQSVLATWCAMAVMVAEHFNPVHAAITFLDRDYLRTHLHPPANMRIWLGNYSRSAWNGCWVHRSMSIADQFIPNPADNTLPQPNTKTSTFVVGKVYFHVFVCEHDFILNKLSLQPSAIPLIAPLWPIVEPAIAWPIQAMSDSQAVAMSEAIFNFLSAIGAWGEANFRSAT
jgi:hypothetical protein